MCKTIPLEKGIAIICNGDKDHECDEKATVYGTKDGQRHYFRSDAAAKQWYDDNYMNTTLGSVVCSICGSAAIDSAYWL